MSDNSFEMPAAMPYSPIAISIGDVCGIGAEIIAKSYAQQPELLRGCCVIGDAAIMRRAVQITGVQAEVMECTDPQAALASYSGDKTPIYVMKPAFKAEKAAWAAINSEALLTLPLGQVSATAGAFAAACVRTGAQLALRGKVAALVTAPLHKEALAAAGEPYPGHTELLQAEAAAFAGRSVSQTPVRMMLANPDLRVVLHTVHMPLKQAIDSLNAEGLLATIHIADRALTRIVGRRAKLAVAGLNPHAGEGGLFGREEIEHISPAVQAAQKLGVQISGPFAPDTIFMRARRQKDGSRPFDAVICMYHDQGLIPVKYLGVEDGVNTTLGLPFVRTSPDHGTAFDIAGTGQASCASLCEALRQAKQSVGVLG
jgi:4-hydroxythreonine-4-phosphate dehydrogenase